MFFGCYVLLMTDLHLGFYMDHDTLKWHQFDPTPGGSDMDEVNAEGWNYMVVHFWDIQTASSHHCYTINVGNISPTDYEAGMNKLKAFITAIG